VSERDSFDHAGPTLRTTIRSRHVLFHPHFINKNDVIRIDIILVLLSVSTFTSNVLAFLVGGNQRLFSSQSQDSTSLTACLWQQISCLFRFQFHLKLMQVNVRVIGDAFPQPVTSLLP